MPNETPSDEPTTSFDALCALVSTYRANETHYESSTFQEAEARNSLINKLFAALGWDVTHEHEQNPYKQEVKIEHRSGGPERERRADYAFYASPNFRDVQFIAEAKRPAISLATVDNYFQAIRYGWNAQTPLVVLTNFCELHILDSRFRPTPEGILERCVRRFTLEDYTSWESFLELYYLFSRAAVHDGAIADYAQTLPRLTGRTIQYGLFKGGHEPLDDAFLEELETMRLELARLFIAADPSLTAPELTESVQRVLDRLVFIRFLEDKYIEAAPLLSEVLRAEQPWTAFVSLCTRLNRTYNGIVFRTHSVVDSSTFVPDASEFLGLCARIDHSQSPYNFDFIPVYVLGHIYERFLENIIDIQHDGVRIVKRPELRRQSGVYYTPEGVCRYIVQAAVVDQVGGRTLPQLRRFRILDPAAGSGSFLIEAADVLFREYTRRLNTSDQGFRPFEYVHTGAGYRPSLHLKRQIIATQLHGIDIDPQAVEVSQLSLYLKLLEEETLGSVHYTPQGEIREAVLPSLDHNIAHGNSILDPQTVSRFSVSTEEKIALAPFDVQAQWPKILANGGFDAVVGNPPYFSVDDTWGAASTKTAMLRHRFPNVYRDKTDVLFYFMARATELCRGRASFIVSRAFLEAYKADRLRAYLANKSHIDRIVDFQNHYLFKGVGITTAIVQWSPESRSRRRTQYYRLLANSPGTNPLAEQIDDSEIFERVDKPCSELSSEPWSFLTDALDRIQTKIDTRGVRLEEFMFVGKGMETGANKVFEVSETDVERWSIPQSWLRRRARNSDIRRYAISGQGPLLIFAPKANTYSDLPTGVGEYLELYRERLGERAAYKRGDCAWWNFTWPLHDEKYGKSRIWCPYLATDNRFALDTSKTFVGLTDTTVIFDSGQKEDLRYLVGILNSAVARFRFRSIGKLKSGGIREYFHNSVGRIPVRRIDWDDSGDRKMHDEICKLVDRLSELEQLSWNARSDQRRETIEHQMATAQHRIDEIVYDLYRVTSRERSRISEVLSMG